MPSGRTGMRSRPRGEAPAGPIRLKSTRYEHRSRSPMSSPLPPGEGGRAAAGEGRRGAEGMTKARSKSAHDKHPSPLEVLRRKHADVGRRRSSPLAGEDRRRRRQMRGTRSTGAVGIRRPARPARDPDGRRARPPPHPALRATFPRQGGRPFIALIPSAFDGAPLREKGSMAALFPNSDDPHPALRATLSRRERGRRWGSAEGGRAERRGDQPGGSDENRRFENDERTQIFSDARY